MAVELYPVSVLSGLKRYIDRDSDATPENDINAGAFTVYQIIIDNILNTSQKVYSKFYDAAAPTVGTTAPYMIIKTPGGLSRTWFFLEGIPFATALSFATVTAGGTAGAVSPTSDVIVTIFGA